MKVGGFVTLPVERVGQNTIVARLRASASASAIAVVDLNVSCGVVTY